MKLTPRLPKVNSRFLLSLILLIYLILATLYSVVTPIGRGADEWAHYWYAQFIAKHGRLPANLSEREAAGYKADWPPLYHLLAAGLTAWVEVEGPPTFKYREDNIRRQLVPAQGSEAILHTEDELFPWQQESLVWHLGRFLSIAFSAGTLLVTYRLGLEVFQVRGNDEVGGVGTRNEFRTPADYGVQNSFRLPADQEIKLLALAAVALLAFNPRFLFTGMLFNYDSLTLLLTTLFLWDCIRVAKGCYSPGGFWGLGLLAGLALLTKYLTALLPLLILLAAWSREVQKEKAEANPSPSLRRRRVMVSLGQAALAYLLVISIWFGYLIVNFNEVEAYGPALGVLAPLIRGDGSDRTVEEIFAWLSGSQAPPPVYIEKPQRTLWQIAGELPLTFWGNPVTRPFPLTWFVILMTGVAGLAAAGLFLAWRNSPAEGWIHRPATQLLLLACLLPVPFMVIRLFGARDPLEAVQGRHILFLAGPAVAILLVGGIYELQRYGTQYAIRNRAQSPYGMPHASRFTFYALLLILLTAAISQLLLLQNYYPPPLPVRTMVSASQTEPEPGQIVLPGGARLVEVQLSEKQEQALQVRLIWQGGAEPAPEDYQTELALVDRSGRTWTKWRAYQTQAHYPTRAWEAGDIIHDDGWLPLIGVLAGNYEIWLRILGNEGTVIEAQKLAGYELEQPVTGTGAAPILWQAGVPAATPPLLQERETIQLTFEADRPGPQVIGPDGLGRDPVETGQGWANFIVEPQWPAGDYTFAGAGEALPLFRVAAGLRSFQSPAITFPLEVNFAGKIKLLGYDLPSRRAEAGEGAPITLYWQSLGWLGEEFVIFTRLLDNQQVVWGGYDRLAQENYSTLLWAPGEVITDGFAVPIDADAPPGVYTLQVGWYSQAGDTAQSLPILSPETGEPTGATAITIGPLKIGGPPPGATVTEVAPQVPVNTILGEQVRLLGVDLNGSPLQQGSSLELTFYWQALAELDHDYTVFVHLRTPTGEIVAQKDAPPLAGAYPTGLWDQGEIIKDRLALPLEQVTPGRYELVVGMYDFSTGTRLAVEGSDDNTILLQSVEVSAE